MHTDTYTFNVFICHTQVAHNQKQQWNTLLFMRKKSRDRLYQVKVAQIAYNRFIMIMFRYEKYWVMLFKVNLLLTYCVILLERKLLYIYLAYMLLIMLQILIWLTEYNNENVTLSYSDPYNCPYNCTGLACCQIYIVFPYIHSTAA